MPRKTLKERKEQNPTDDKSNRVRAIIDSTIGIEDPDDLMLEIISTLTESKSRPQEGKYYTFIYNPKSTSIRYDQNPLVAVTNVFSWGFRGINFHWGESRQYTWDEIVGGIYEVYADEISDMREIPYRNIRSK